MERINATIATNERSNWTSAASSYSFATPGLINSHRLNLVKSEEWLTIEPNLFSPNQDGENDIVSLHISNEYLNAMATIKIFDSQGNFITNIANNIPIGTNQTWFWDGTFNENKKAPIGIYIVYAEIFGLDDKKLIKKKTVIIGD